MKTNLLKKTGAWLMMAMLALWSGTTMAQQKVTDKDLHGVWLMESFYFEGEDKVKCGVDYTQVKVYRPNGEYACAEIVKLKNGQFQILPHEYGTYTFKNGKYTEMGRDGNLNLVDKNTFTGQWFKRHDVWKKCTDMPDRLTDYIVDVCKAHQTPATDIQQLIDKYMFNK